MIIHSIVSEFDIFYNTANYMNPQYEQKNGNDTQSAIPCITNPAEFLKPAENPYLPNQVK